MFPPLQNPQNQKEILFFSFFLIKKSSRVDHFQKIRFSFGAVHKFWFGLHPVGGHLDLCCLAFSISCHIWGYIGM